MKNMAEMSGILPGIRYFGPAKVIASDEKKGYIRLFVQSHEHGGKGFETLARVAVSDQLPLRWGDEVLALGESVDDFYIIGILSENPAVMKPETLTMQCGVTVTICGNAGAEKMEVTSPDGSMLFEYDHNAGKSRVAVASGDIEITTADGDIEFTSARGICLSAKDSVCLKSRKDVTISAAGSHDSENSKIVAGRNGLSLTSHEIGIRTDIADLHIDETRLAGKKLQSAVKSVKMVTDRLETVAGTVKETIGNLYRRIDGLQQTCAKRMRTLVEESYHFKSKKAYLKADDDFKIKGDKIYLG